MKLSLIQSLSRDSIFFSRYFSIFNVRILHLTYCTPLLLLSATRVNIHLNIFTDIYFIYPSQLVIRSLLNNIPLILFKSFLNLVAAVCIIVDDCDIPHFIISYQMNQKLLSFSFSSSHFMSIYS